MTRTRITVLAALAAGFATSTFAQPAPEEFKLLARQVRSADAVTQLTITEGDDADERGILLMRISMDGSAPLYRRGQLAEADRDELRRLLAVVAPLPDDTGQITAPPARNYDLELANGQWRSLIPRDGTALDLALRPVDQVLDRITQALIAGEAPAFLWVTLKRDSGPDAWVDSHTVRGDGGFEMREAVGRAIRELRGPMTQAEQAEAAAAVREAELGAMIDVPAATFPRLRISHSLQPGQTRDLTISDSGPVAARLGRLRALMTAVADRLRAAATPGWATIRRGSHHPAVAGSVELERAESKARMGMGDWVAITPAELAALDHAMSALDLPRMTNDDPGPTPRLSLDLVLGDGLIRSLGRNQDANGQVLEPRLQALDDAILAIIRRLKSGTLPTTGVVGSLQGE